MVATKGEGSASDAFIRPKKRMVKSVAAKSFAPPPGNPFDDVANGIGSLASTFHQGVRDTAAAVTNATGDAGGVISDFFQAAQDFKWPAPRKPRK
jgi:hypothetical protein